MLKTGIGGISKATPLSDRAPFPRAYPEALRQQKINHSRVRSRFTVIFPKVLRRQAMRSSRCLPPPHHAAPRYFATAVSV